MQKGSLSEYFTGVAAKRLKRVEADPASSNQHEFNGVNKLRQILGADRMQFAAHFIYLTDDDPEPIESEAVLTWYDSRISKTHRSAEWRLYFPTTPVSECFSAGDLIVFARRQDGSLLVVVAEDGSTILNQVAWLFDLDVDGHPGYSVRGDLESDHDRLGFTSRLILETIGVQIDVADESQLDQMVASFGDRLPPTRVFSEFARKVVGPVDCVADPDGTLLAWMDKEEILFRTFERHLLWERLRSRTDQDEPDVDGMMSFFLSAHNTRKSRAGRAFENHLEALFLGSGIRFTRSATTERKSKPDFLFPGSAEYHDPRFDEQLLTFLGAKTTCKDRWRQVLPEADRVANKHLVTLEPSISVNQTDEMRANNLQLVVPTRLKGTFSTDQQAWLINLLEFNQLVLERQHRMS